MMPPKTARNKRMLAAFKKGRSIYSIAKHNNMSWTRAKEIIVEQQMKEETE